MSSAPPDYRDVVIHLNPHDLMYMGLDNLVFTPSRHRFIGYWHWELPIFPEAWAPALNIVDEIWTPSEFGATIFRNRTKKPVRVIPHAVPENHILREEARKQLKLPADRFIFLMIYDGDSFQMRKNPEGVLRAFIDAFDGWIDETPLLVIKMHGAASVTGEFGKLLKKAQDKLSVVIINEVFQELQIRQLQAACDCYVSLHRSECFGLNIAECMAAGRLTIVTDFSGSKDFANTGNAIPIPYEMRAVQPEEYIFSDGQWWAEPNHEAVVEAMRWAVANPAAAERLARKAKSDMSHHYSFKRVGLQTTRALRSRNK